MLFIQEEHWPLIGTSGRNKEKERAEFDIRTKLVCCKEDGCTVTKLRMFYFYFSIVCVSVATRWYYRIYGLPPIM